MACLFFSVSVGPPVVWAEVAVLPCGTAILNSRRAKGHETAHVAK